MRNDKNFDRRVLLKTDAMIMEALQERVRRYTGCKIFRLEFDGTDFKILVSEASGKTTKPRRDPIAGKVMVVHIEVTMPGIVQRPLPMPVRIGTFNPASNETRNESFVYGFLAASAVAPYLLEPPVMDERRPGVGKGRGIVKCHIHGNRFRRKCDSQSTLLYRYVSGHGE